MTTTTLTVLPKSEPVVETPKVTTPVAPAPTIGSALGTSNYDKLEQAKQTLLGLQAKLGGTTPTKTGTNFNLPGLESQDKYVDPSYISAKDQRDIDRRQMRLFQGEIDATNRLYDQMYGEAKMQGEGRLGTTAALNARSGLLGSDFGQAQADVTGKYNKGILDSVRAERQIKIGEILGKVREGAAAEIAAKRKAQMDSADALLKFNADKANRRTNNLNVIVSSLLDQGVDITELSPEDIKAIQDQTGLTQSEIAASYSQQKKANEAASAAEGLKTRKTEAEIAKIEADIAKGKLIELSEGTMLYNTETGETFKNPKTYAPKTGSSVSDSTAEGIRKFLEENRGSDTYTDTGKYMESYKAFVNNGGTPEEFMKIADPDVYIRPDDASAGWIKSQMKKGESVDPIDQAIADALAQSLAVPQ